MVKGSLFQAGGLGKGPLCPSTGTGKKLWSTPSLLGSSDFLYFDKSSKFVNSQICQVNLSLNSFNNTDQFWKGRCFVSKYYNAQITVLKT